METKSTLHEKSFVPGTSRNRESRATLRLVAPSNSDSIVAKRNELELLEMGQRIAQLREAHGYKQEWIADQVGVKLRTYQFWQQGKHPPTGEALEKLAALFDVTPRYILKGETPDPFAGDDRLDRLLAAVKHLDQRLDEAQEDRQLASLQTIERAAAILSRLDDIEALLQERSRPQRRQRA